MEDLEAANSAPTLATPKAQKFEESNALKNLLEAGEQ